LPHLLLALSFYGGGNSSRTSNSILATSRYNTATTSRQFAWSPQLLYTSKHHYNTLIYIITGYARNHKRTKSISHIYRLNANQLTV
jgi:hypothetical protein